MFSLNLLGTASISGPSGPLIGRASQRRQLALLALLAAAGPRGASRDKLAAYLWPESGTDAARHLLADALYLLRGALGEDAVPGVSDQLRLNPEVVSCDLTAFENALRAHAASEAVAVYTGPFLDGFHLSHAVAFERWIDEQRSRLTQGYVDALGQLARLATISGDHTSAVSWWRRLAVVDPLDASVALDLMRALVAAGDSAGALLHARAHTAAVNAELDTRPDSRIVQLAERIRVGALDAPGITVQFPEPHAQRAVSEPASSGSPNVARSSAVVLSPAPTGGAAISVALRGRLRSKRVVGLLLLTPLITAIAVLAAATTRAKSAARLDYAANLDTDVVAITPFRVSPDDTSLAYLREGIMDLLAMKLTGDGTPRAIDPRTMLVAWHRVADVANGRPPTESVLHVARALHAGEALFGEAVRVPDGRLVVSATIVATRQGVPRAYASATGPEDSLPALIDALAAQITSGRSPLGQSLVAARAPLPALDVLRPYISGQHAYREGRYAEAVEFFAQSLRVDSTFAPAALQLAEALSWSESSSTSVRFDAAVRLAAAYRNGLSPVGKALYAVFIGLDYPRPRLWHTWLPEAQRALDEFPDNADLWYQYGETLFHAGALHGITNSRSQAARALSRAVALDSSITEPLLHLVDIASHDSDTVALRTLGAIYLSRHSTSETADFIRWRVAVALGDSSALWRLRAHFRDVPDASLERIIGTSEVEGLMPEDAWSAALILRNRTMGPTQEIWLEAFIHNLLLNRGRPGEALKVLVDAQNAGLNRATALQQVIADALYWGGDSGAAAVAVRELEPTVEKPLSPIGTTRETQVATICWVGLWELAHGMTRDISTDIAHLRKAAAGTPDQTTTIGTADLCGAMIGAEYSFTRRVGERNAYLLRLDSLLTFGADVTGTSNALAQSIPLAIADLHERLHDPVGALNVIRRRWTGWKVTDYMSTYFLREARLSALTGDRAGAERAYGQYLAMRANPEASLRPERKAAQEAWSALAALTDVRR